MAQRITQVGVMIEYVPADKRRVTAVGVMIEYKPKNPRKYGPKAQAGR